MPKSRKSIDAELAGLAASLPEWRQTVRREAPFWAQLRALVEAILVDATARDAAYVRDRILRMLNDERIDPAQGGDEFTAWLDALVKDSRV